jgi:hypothetical protein
MFIASTPEEVIRVRLVYIKHGLEAELKGFRLTRKAPPCFSIIKKEFGIKGRDKKKSYSDFCAKFGFEPKAELLA